MSMSEYWKRYARKAGDSPTEESVIMQRDLLHRILTRILSKEGLHTPAVNISVTMNEVNGTKTTEELIEFLWEEMNR